MSTPAGDAFLNLLDSDPASAEQKYRTLRSKLVFYFCHNGCLDPENLADETIERVIRKLSSGADAYSGVGAYCYGVAGHVLQEERRRPRGQELPDELPNRGPGPPGELSRSEQIILLKEFLSRLPKDDRDLLTRYYLDDREQLALSESLSVNGLRIRVFRIRQKLQDCLRPPRAISRGSETL